MTDNVRCSSTARPAGRDDLDGLARLLHAHASDEERARQSVAERVTVHAGTRSVPLYRRALFEPSPVLLHRARPQE